MEPVVVRKSAVHQLLLVLAGAILIVAALDIMAFHWVSSPPEVDSETGEINSTGRSQDRGDLLWGSVLTVTGAGLVIAGAAGAIRRQPVAVVGADGLELRVAGPVRTITIPWGEVAWVHSGSDGDDERVPTRVFLVHVEDAGRYPAAPWGAEWDGDTLMVDAADWTVRPADLVIYANVALTDWRRHHGQIAHTDAGSGPTEAGITTGGEELPGQNGPAETGG
jgi:hypothetical protein